MALLCGLCFVVLLLQKIIQQEIIGKTQHIVFGAYLVELLRLLNPRILARWVKVNVYDLTVIFQLFLR